MKFRITTKDFVIFVIFCVFLFYLCCIGILNFSYFSSTGNFYGLNPVEAFSAEYFPGTIALFAVALVIIFTSVSSYIFEKEKGGGIGLKLGAKEDKGYSRWANEKEVKKADHVERVILADEKFEAAGVPLITTEKEMYVDDGENHSVIIGATASGKTTCIVDPLVYCLSKKGESMIITDPKGEIYKNHGQMLRDRGYNVIVLNFRDPIMGSSWNPLSLPYQLFKEGNIDKSVELLEDVAANILTGDKTDDPFWQNNASDYFSGIALGLFEDATDESQVNLNSIGYMATTGEEKLGITQYIKEYFNLKGESSSSAIFASSVVNAPSETKGGVVSVFRQKIRLFTSRDNLSEMLSKSDFDMRKIGQEKTAVFLVIHDEKTTYHALATIFIKQCYETLIDTAYKEKNGKLPFKTNFILDEFANMPKLKDVTSMVTAARSRAVRFTFIIQNFAQLDDVYGKEDSQTIRSNCGNLIYLITTELAALEEISKLCGEVKSKDKDKTASTPLVTVSDLQKLPMNNAIIIKTRLHPFKTKYIPSYKTEWFKNMVKTDFYSREKNEIKLFELKEFVKEEKRKKLFENLEKGENPSNMNAPYPGDRPSPFGGGGMPGTPGGFNFDELAKKIDARIAELEKEDKKKSPGLNPMGDGINNQSTSNDFDLPLPNLKPEAPKPPLEKPSFNIYNEEPKVEEKVNVPNIETVKEETPKVNVDKDSKIVSENVITDDQFFDDFFQDDE